MGYLAEMHSLVQARVAEAKRTVALLLEDMDQLTPQQQSYNMQQVEKGIMAALLFPMAGPPIRVGAMLQLQFSDHVTSCADADCPYEKLCKGNVLQQDHSTSRGPC